MAGSLTQWGETLLLNYAIGRPEADLTHVPTGGLFLGLAQNTSVGESGSQAAFIELSHGGYARQQLVPNRWSAVETAATASTVTYTSGIEFPPYSGISLITVTYLVLYTQPSGGSPVWYSKIEDNAIVGRILQTGDVIEIAANSIVLSLD